MPPSSVTPEMTYDAFHTREKFTLVARRLGVTRLTLRRWWVAKFGAAAVEARSLGTKQTLEEKKQRQKAHREVNKDSIRAKKRAWVEANSEKVRLSKQAHRQTHAEEYREYCRNYYATNAEKMREASRAYRRANPTLVREKERNYYIENPEILLLKCAKQRARKDGLPFTITAEDIRQLMPVDGCCPITRVPFKRGIGKVGPQSMTLDKIEPAKGYVPGNIAVISHLANTIKQNCTDPQIFLRLAAYLERPCP
jgi:hypothetical protein